MLFVQGEDALLVHCESRSTVQDHETVLLPPAFGLERRVLRDGGEHVVKSVTFLRSAGRNIMYSCPSLPQMSLQRERQRWLTCRQMTSASFIASISDWSIGLRSLKRRQSEPGNRSRPVVS